MNFPKPKARATEAVTVFRDGRECCNIETEAGRNEYMRRITLMWERQRHCCCICYQPMRLAECSFEHEAGRGHGGGHRDDRIEAKGQWINGAAHSGCNYAKGSQRGRYNR